MAALKVDISGLHAVAASLRSAAQTLAAVGAKPLAHAPLATDETSTSAAARLSEHGSVVASRATDAAAVLNSAADAIVQAAQSYTAMNTANAPLVSLQGSPAPATASPTPAVTADRIAVHVPIAAQTSRPAETTAAIMEAGQAGAGAPFLSGCTALGEAFGEGARSARNAAGTVNQHLQGAAGPTISAALNRYADWSDSMTRYTHSLGQMADDHRERFSQAQHSIPSTTDFADRHRELQNAISVYSTRPTPGAAQAVSKAHSNVDALTNRTHVVATTYRTGEEPASPPGPPPVVPIVEPGAGRGDTPPTTGQDGTDPPTQSGKAKVPVGADDDGDDVLPEDGAGNLGDGLDPMGSPAAGGGAGMAGSLPSMMTGLLGGVVGMAASIPEKLGQEAQQFAQQATQAVSGLASGLGGKDKLDNDLHPGDLADSFGGGGGGGGDDGGGGATTPASDGGSGDLKPAASAMGSVEPGPPPLAGLSGAAPSAPTAAAAGVGGAPMFMPPMGGMGAGAGGGATREVKEPDKTIVPPTRPNSEPVKGERRDPARHTATVESPGPRAGEPAKRAVTVTSRTRRIEKPDSDDKGGGK